MNSLRKSCNKANVNSLIKKMNDDFLQFSKDHFESKSRNYSRNTNYKSLVHNVKVINAGYVNKNVLVNPFDQLDYLHNILARLHNILIRIQNLLCSQSNCEINVYINTGVLNKQTLNKYKATHNCSAWNSAASNSPKRNTQLINTYSPSNSVISAANTPVKRITINTNMPTQRSVNSKRLFGVSGNINKINEIYTFLTNKELVKFIDNYSKLYTRLSKLSDSNLKKKYCKQTRSLKYIFEGVEYRNLLQFDSQFLMKEFCMILKFIDVFHDYYISKLGIYVIDNATMDWLKNQ